MQVSRAKSATAQRGPHWPPEVRFFNRLLDDLSKSLLNEHIWQAFDPTFERLCMALILQPWNVELQNNAAQRLTRLRDARNEWITLVNGNIVSDNDLLAKISGIADPEVANLVKKWRSGFVGNVNRVVRLNSVFVPAGYSTNVYIYVGDGSRLYQQCTPGSSSGINASDALIGITWSIGDPIPVVLEEDARWGNWNRIEYTAGGPLALWKLHNRGVPPGNTGFQLQLDVPSCPGPPTDRALNADKQPVLDAVNRLLKH